MSRAAAAGGLVVLALLATSCVTRPRSGGGDLMASGTPLALTDPEVAERLATLEARAEARGSLVASARVALDAPDLRFRRPQRLAVRRPSDLRVEVLGLFGQVAAVLVTDGNRYQLWNSSDHSLQEGPVSPGLLWDVARVDLEPSVAVDLLLGAPRPEPGLVLAGAARLPDESVVLAFRGPPGLGQEVFQIDHASRVVRILRDAADGSLLWEVAYEDFREVDDRLFPHALTIDFPRFDAHAVFAFKSAELNRDLSGDLFVLSIETAEREP